MLNPHQLPLSNTELSKCNINELLILHYNCRSMINKVTDIHNICNLLNPSIICLTETWLDTSSKETAYIPEGYNIIRKDRSERFKQKYGKNNGGGIAVLYKKELKVRKLNISTDTEETLWIEVKSKPTFILGTVYRANYTDLLTDSVNGTILEDTRNFLEKSSSEV